MCSYIVPDIESGASPPQPVGGGDRFARRRAIAFGSPSLPCPDSSPGRGRRARTAADRPGAGLSRTMPDYPGLSRTGTGRNHPENRASIRGETAQAFGNTGFAETPADAGAPPDGPRAAISRPCRAPFPASANDAAPRAARKPDHGPRDNFRLPAGHGRPRAWRGWAFRAGGAARARAPGVPREKISRDNFAAAGCRKAPRITALRPPPRLWAPGGPPRFGRGTGSAR